MWSISVVIQWTSEHWTSTNAHFVPLSTLQESLESLYHAGEISMNDLTHKLSSYRYFLKFMQQCMLNYWHNVESAEDIETWGLPLHFGKVYFWVALFTNPLDKKKIKKWKKKNRNTHSWVRESPYGQKYLCTEEWRKISLQRQKRIGKKDPHDIKTQLRLSLVHK